MFELVDSVDQNAIIKVIGVCLLYTSDAADELRSV